jgi:hypothetical protein
MMQKADDPEHEGVIKEILKGKSVTQMVDFLANYTASANILARMGMPFRK